MKAPINKENVIAQLSFWQKRFLFQALTFVFSNALVALLELIFKVRFTLLGGAFDYGAFLPHLLGRRNCIAFLH